MPQDTSVAIPEVKAWSLRDKTGTTRTFEQSELTIDGEVRLFQLSASTIQHLNKANFPWDEATKIVDEYGEWDWIKAAELLTLAVSELPELVSESVCIFFGLAPFNEDGSRNTTYESDKLFVRRSISFTRWVDILQVFIEQNDYNRLARPFGSALTRAMEIGMTNQLISNQQRQSETSLPESTYLSNPGTEETPETLLDASQDASTFGT